MVFGYCKSNCGKSIRIYISGHLQQFLSSARCCDRNSYLFLTFWSVWREAIFFINSFVSFCLSRIWVWTTFESVQMWTFRFLRIKWQHPLIRRVEVINNHWKKNRRKLLYEPKRKVKQKRQIHVTPGHLNEKVKRPRSVRKTALHNSAKTRTKIRIKSKKKVSGWRKEQCEEDEYCNFTTAETTTVHMRWSSTWGSSNRKFLELSHLVQLWRKKIIKERGISPKVESPVIPSLLELCLLEQTNVCSNRHNSCFMSVRMFVVMLYVC